MIFIAYTLLSKYFDIFIINFTIHNYFPEVSRTGQSVMNIFFNLSIIKPQENHTTNSNFYYFKSLWLELTCWYICIIPSL